MTIAKRTCFVTLLALSVASGQSRPRSDESAAGFPIGTYTSCAQGTHNPPGNKFLNSAGFQDGARLTLSQNGAIVTSAYVDQDGVGQSLGFSLTTRTVATIARKGQSIPGFRSQCVPGPGRGAVYPANMTVAGGALTYRAGMVFLTLVGDLRSDAGECGTLSQPQASFWLACEDRQGGAVSSVEAGPAPPVKLPAGRYSCSTQIETLGHMNGRNHYVAGGATGTLILAKDGAMATAEYSGDPSLAGTLRFTATTPATAGAEAGQTLMAPCMIPSGTGRTSGTPERVPIAAASLTMVEATLFLSFAGTMPDGSSCPGAKVAGSLICSK